MKSERIKNASRNMVYGIILKIYQIILPFVMRTIMVYYLGIQYLGLNSLFTSILQVLNLAEMGIGSAIVFTMYKPIAEDDNTTICALMRLYKIYYSIIGMVILVCGFILLPFMPRLIKGSVPADVNLYILYLLNLMATVLTYWMWAYRSSVLQAYQRMDLVSKVTIATDSLKYILQIVALMVCKNYYLYVFAIIFTQILTNLLVVVVSKIKFPQCKAIGRLPKEKVKEINRRIKDLFTAKLGGVVVSSADMIVISAFLGLTTLAIYQNYYYIMSSVVMIITVVLNSCTASIGNSMVTESKEKNYKDFEKFFLMDIWIIGICFCCFLNLYQPFMTIWMGEDKLLDNGSVICLCVYFYLFTVNQFMTMYKDAAGIWHEDCYRPLIGGIVNLCLNLALVHYYGIFAIILSTVISYAVINVPWIVHNIFKYFFKCSSKAFIKNLVKYTVMILGAALFTKVLCLIHVENNVLCLIYRLIVSVLVPNVIFVLALHNKKEFSDVLDLIDKVTRNKTVCITNKLCRR